MKSSMMIGAGLQSGGRAAIGSFEGQRVLWSSQNCARRRGRARVSLMSSVQQVRSSSTSFDPAAYDKERLKLDRQARDVMAEVAEERTGPGAWKWEIRKRIWDAMEATGVAMDPRPVHNRIPNFKGASEAAARLARLPEFEAARCVKVNPDTPQKTVRYFTLSAGKTLLTPQPRLRTGFFSTLEAKENIPPGVQVIEACTSAGAAKYGQPVGLDAQLAVDLIVIGSVAVDPVSGARLGKGEGFAELEYGMLRYMGAIDDNTLVVTSVHDMQVVEEGLIPAAKLLIHDVPVDVICTPTRTIFTSGSIPKPHGIYWDKLSPQKLAQIRILQTLKKKIEEQTGNAFPTGPSEQLPPSAKRSQKVWRKPRPAGSKG